MNRFLATIGPFVLGIACTAASAQCPQGAGRDEAIRERVTAALQSDQYFYDKHVTVSMEDGDVVLRGLVFSDWDLRDAPRIATMAACNLRDIDELKIVVGGRR